MAGKIEGWLYGQNHIFLEKLCAVRGNVRIFVGLQSYSVSNGAGLKGIRTEAGQFFADKAVNVTYRDAGAQLFGELR